MHPIRCGLWPCLAGALLLGAALVPAAQARVNRICADHPWT
ncbi:MAG: hypothetical protein QE285_03385 [Aquabacterium sp.]|nr:hypothetical protein [Aquabacterium sp.]